MISNFTSADVPDQSGKTFFITGANTGIGFETAKVLGARGARVLMGCRNPTKAKDARDRILAAHPEAELVLIEIDLGNLASIRSAAEVVASEERLDVLINNAGLMVPPRQLTADGFESQFGVNHLGGFALTGLLLPLLERTADARILTTSSNGHRMGAIDFDDVNAERSYSAMGRYGMSKIANLYHAYELDRRLRRKGSSTIALSVHPGGTATDLMRHIPSWLVGLTMPLAKLVINDAPAGAWPTLLGATHPEVKGGTYYGPANWGEISGPAKQVDSNALSKDEDIARRLWDLSVEMTGVDPGLS